MRNERLSAAFEEKSLEFITLKYSGNWVGGFAVCLIQESTTKSCFILLNIASILKYSNRFWICSKTGNLCPWLEHLLRSFLLRQPLHATDYSPSAMNPHFLDKRPASILSHWAFRLEGPCAVASLAVSIRRMKHNGVLSKLFPCTTLSTLAIYANNAPFTDWRGDEWICWVSRVSWFNQRSMSYCLPSDQSSTIPRTPSSSAIFTLEWGELEKWSWMT